MKILIISNFYPPARPGGYTQWCFEVTEKLRGRGHQMAVLTSCHEADKAAANEQNIYRELFLDGDLFYYQPVHFFRNWAQEQKANLSTLQRIIQADSPDLIFVWGMWALSHSLPARAEQLMPGRVVYFLSDYWAMSTDMHSTYWQMPAKNWYMRSAKNILRKVAQSKIEKANAYQLNFDRAICVSQAVKDILIDAGLPLENARVIHGGSDVERFVTVANRNYQNRRLRLLYAGQLVEHKGVHTALEAIAILAKKRKIDRFQLTLVGGGHPAYEKHIKKMAMDSGIETLVDFRKRIARGEMPALMGQHDILIFPSIYEEPFARMTQEAMAAGLVVVGTTTGGTKEILKEEITGLTFEAENAHQLANQLERLAKYPDLLPQLSAAGRKMVLERFTLTRMVDDIETYLEKIFTGVATKTDSKLAISNDANIGPH